MKKTDPSRFLPALLLLLTACGGAVTQMPPEQREPFDRCWNVMQQPICGDSNGDQLYINTCRRRAGNEFAELQTQTQRDEWLLGHGCPVSMVHPESVNEYTDSQ